MVNATPQSRPRFHPWHRPILRRPGEVQFGLLPDGPIVAGLTGAEVSLLDRLDGSRSLLACFREAAAAGVDITRWRELVDLLDDLGLIESMSPFGPSAVSVSAPPSRLGSGSPPGSPSVRERTVGITSVVDPPGSSGASEPMGPVVVEGSGPLAEQLVTLLGGDLMVRAASLRCALPTWVPLSARSSLSPLTVDHVTAAPALVVLVGAPALDPRAGDRWLASGTAHLPVSAAGRRTTIGPLVEGPSGPCLWCLDLHRADRDDAWPTVMAQLCPADATGFASPTPSPLAALGTNGHDLLAAAELHLTAGSVAAFVQGVLAGHRPPPGISIDICLPWPRMDHRRWAVHPRCPRHDDGTGPDDDRQAPGRHRADEAGAVA